MNPTLSPKITTKDEFDTLSMYHHATYAFESKLLDLLAILNMPKEFKLAERFEKIELLLDKMFRIELIHHLQPLKTPVHNENTSPEHQSHPQILLHFWCLLECTHSPEYIAKYLGLTIEEVQELIRELHHTFSIESLVSRIQEYYEENKSIRETSEVYKKNEQLGIETSFEPKDTTEDRKQRLKRRYGHLSTVFDLLSHTL